MKNGDKSFPTFKEFYTEQSTVSKIGQGVGKAVGSVAAAPFKLAGGLLKGIGSAFKKNPATPAAQPATTVSKPVAPAKPVGSSGNIKGEAPGAQASLDDVYGKQAVDPMKGATAYKPIRPVAASTTTANTTPAVDPFADEKPKTTTAVAATPKTPADSEFEAPKNPPAVFTPATTTPKPATPSVYDNTKEISDYGAKEPPTAPTTPTSPPIAPTTPGAPPPKGMGLNPDATAGTITVGGTGRFTGLRNVFINPDKITASDTIGNKFVRDTPNSPWRLMKSEEDTGVKEVDRLPSVL